MKAHLHRARQHSSHLFAIAAAAVLVALAIYAVVRTTVAQTTVSAADQQLRLYMHPGATTLYPGDTTTVQLRLSHSLSSQRVNYAEARVQFTPSVLEVVSISRAGSAFTMNGGPELSFVNTAGMLTVRGQSPSYLAQPSDTLLATVTFRTKAAGTSAVRYTAGTQAGETQGASGKVRDYMTGSAGTSLQVSNRPSVPAPTPAPAPAPSPAPAPRPTPTPAPAPGSTEPQPSDTAPDDATADNPDGTDDGADDATSDDDSDSIPIGTTDRTGNGGTGGTGVSVVDDASLASGMHPLLQSLMWGLGVIALIILFVGGLWWRQRMAASSTPMVMGMGPMVNPFDVDEPAGLQTPYRDIRGLGGTAIYASNYLSGGYVAADVVANTDPVVPDAIATEKFVIEQQQVAELPDDNHALESQLTSEPVEPTLAAQPTSDDDMFESLGNRFDSLAPTTAAAATTPLAHKRRVKRPAADTPHHTPHAARLVVPQRRRHS